MFARITDHIEGGKSLLLDQYRGKCRLEALLACYLRPVQQLEDAVWSVRLGRMIENAIGVQLDVIGRIVGRQRRGMNDATYRTWLNVQIAINRSEGHPDDVIRVIALVEDDFRLLEYFPASFDVEFRQTPIVDPLILAEMVGATRAAGVDGAVVVSPESEAETIVGSHDEDLMTDTQGGADDAETVGGVGANVYP